MRIVHGVNDLRDSGNGIINHVVDLACEQAADNDVWIVSRGGNFESLVRPQGVRTENVQLGRRPADMIRAVRRARSVFRSGADVAHAHTVTTFVIFFIARLGIRRRPLLVSTIHNSWQRSFRLMTLADVIITVSEAEGRRLRGLVRRPQKVVAIRNCVIGGVRLRRQGDAALPLKQPSITTVAGLFPRKGIDDLLVAFSKVGQAHDAHLYILGQGPSLDELRELAERLGVTADVTFAGFEPKPLEWLRGSDIFVLASHAEPGGLVLDEARSAGCAVIATDVGGNADRVEGGAAAILVPPAQPDRLAAALQDLLASPEALARAREASGLGLDKHTVDVMAAATVELYRRGR